MLWTRAGVGMREELGVKNLREIKEVFDELGIRYWLDYGTLLGAVREGKIIEWDYNMDLGMLDDHWKRSVFAFHKLKKRGFQVRIKDWQIDNNFFERSCMLSRFGWNIEVSPSQVRGKYALWAGILPKNLFSRGLTFFRSLLLFPERPVRSKLLKVVKYRLSLLPSKVKKLFSDVIWSVLRRIDRLIIVVIPKHYYEKLETIKFYGMTFNVPSDVENYLKYHYGEDWRTPKKEWNSEEDDHAVRILRKGITSFLYLRIHKGIIKVVGERWLVR